MRHGTATRYPDDVSIFAAIDLADDRGWSDLAELISPGDMVGLCGAAVPEPRGSGLAERFRMLGRQYVCDVPVRLPSPDLGVDVVELIEADWPEMVELVALTEPGPFRSRTPVLGRYLGIRDGGRLVAMAGERMRPAGATEISAVCTHPDARRRGLAGLLTARVAERIQERGELPFLHTSADNVAAQQVYEGLGFRVRTNMYFVGIGLDADD